MSSIVGRIVVASVIVLAFAGAIVYAATRPDDAAPAPRSTGSWGALAPGPLARTEVGAARIGDRIYLVGGFDSRDGTTGAVARYDISADRWATVAPLPIAVNHAGVAAVGNRVYVYGGNVANSGGEEKSDRLYRYDPRRDRWSRLTDASSERAAIGFAGIGRKLYAVGGYTVDDQSVRELAIYDVRRDLWRSGPDLPTGRNHVGAAVLNGRLIVTGGRPGDVNGGLTTVESYDPRKRRWSRLRPLATARSGHAAVAAGGKLIVFGGEELGDGGTTIEQVEAYDPGTHSWSTLPEMVTPRHGLGGVARRGRVYAIEGGPRPGLSYSAAIEFLDVGR